MLPTKLGALALVLSNAALAAPLTADDVVRAALDHHPDLVAAQAGILAARGERQAVGTFLENPEVQVGLPAVGDLTSLQVVQPLSITGEGWFARREARFGLDAAVATAGRAELVLAADARLAWADAVVAERRAALADEALALATRFRSAVDARAGAGELSALDVSLARAREAEAAANAMQARSERADALVGLTAYHPDAATLGVAGTPLEAVPSGGSRAVPAAARLDVVAAEDRAAQARAGVSRARAAAMPLVSVGLTLESEGGVIDAGPMLQLGLPLWSRNQAGIADARGAADLADAQLDWTRAIASAEGLLGDQTAAAAAAVWERTTGAEASAADGLRYVEAAFANGELDVRDAVLLQGELLDGRLAALEVERHTAAARLGALLAHDDATLLTGAAAVAR